MLEFRAISAKQAVALGKIAKYKNGPGEKMIIGFNPLDKDAPLVVVPPSRYDNRRWDVTKGGKITRTTRFKEEVKR